ncbi:hypothetical protein A4A49_07080 [Nicotiana attenuata]|uniref:Uncharacterized protein n=1 Tax=Nicotiana attenuata TaxID=49451 RepID=A0A1J6IRZ6_NICAT|nr:hypothetical protein A4A49_07080 [Nicotiana attenuata]
MATLADSFLADLDELSDYVLDEENLDAEDLADMLDNVSKLQKSRRYIDVMQKVEDALIDVTNKGNSVVLEDDDPEFQFIVACNALLIDIENEILIIHNFIHGRIGKEMDVARVDLKGPLTSGVNIMAVCVAASTTNGKPLPEDVLQKTLEACDRAIALDSAKKKEGSLADKSMLAARIDSNRGKPTGEYGKSLKEEILKKIEKSQERPPARLPKSLSVPKDTKPKNKRGGGRDRKRKERYEMTDSRKLANLAYLKKAPYLGLDIACLVRLEVVSCVYQLK